MMRIRVVLACFLTLLVLGSYAAAQAPPVTASDPAKAALIEELIVALKVEQNQQQVMQTMQNAMQKQVGQMVDSQLKTLGNGGPASAEKMRQAQGDVENFERRMFALMNSHMSWQTMKPGVPGNVRRNVYQRRIAVPLVAFMKFPGGASLCR